jgi:hypothetical protein
VLLVYPGLQVLQDTGHASGIIASISLGPIYSNMLLVLVFTMRSFSFTGSDLSWLPNHSRLKFPCL